MRRLFWLGILLTLVGCRGVAGPLQPQTPGRDDDPLLTIGEQQRNGRARLPLPDESNLAPQSSGAERPGTWPGNYGR
jgi:hypothetical protein